MKCPIAELKLQHRGSFKAYRNIATCNPTQDLYDDLVDEEHFSILQYADNISSGIDHDLPQTRRVEQYGNIEDSIVCFQENFWNWTRFGTTKFGVWYGALDEETSIKETIIRSEIDKNDRANAIAPIIAIRRLFKAQLRPRVFADLRPWVEEFQDLVHDTDYSFCQSMGSYAKSSNIDMYLTPSVRNPGGTCTPVFDAEVIEDKIIRDYMVVYPLDGRKPVRTDFIKA